MIDDEVVIEGITSPFVEIDLCRSTWGVVVVVC
jgi:hypothetical protein